MNIVIFLQFAGRFKKVSNRLSLLVLRLAEDITSDKNEWGYQRGKIQSLLSPDDLAIFHLRTGCSKLIRYRRNLNHLTKDATAAGWK